MQHRRDHEPTADAALALIAALVGAWILFRSPGSESLPATGREIVQTATDIGWLLIVAALLIPSLRMLAAAHQRLSGNRAAQSLLLLAVPMLLAIVLLYDRIGATKTATIGGERVFWLDDDAMISMRYARNLALGHGLVWNAGEPPVEGYSNFLWTLLLTLPHLIGVPDRLTSAFPIALNVLLLGGVLGLAARVGRKMGLGPAAIVLALLLLAANRWIIHWAAAGSENIFLALVLLAAVDRCLTASRGRPMGPGGGLLIGLAPLIRADGLIYLVAFLPALILLHRRGRLRWSALVAMLLPVVLHFLFRRATYGQWMPNTYHLKAADIPMKEAMGVFYISFFFYFWGAVCVLHLLGLRWGRRPVAAALGLVPWVTVGYAVLIGGDELPELRFLVPVLPLFALGALGAGEAIFLGKPGGGKAPIRLGLPGGHGWLVIALTIGAFRSLCLPAALEGLGLERGRIEENNVRIGMLIERNTEPDALVAHYWAGAAPYFSRRPAHDMLGKNDPTIAQGPGHPGQWQPGHTKYDAAYSLGLEPDVIVTALPAALLDPEVQAADPSCRDYPSLCSLYGKPSFAQGYSGGLVEADVSRSFHAIFVREASSRARPPADWR